MDLQCDSLQLRIRILTVKDVHFYMLPIMLKCILLQISLIILLTKSVSLEICKEKLLEHELVYV